jgi:UDP-N-acetylmuramoyl-L-alanyl-D-glutamate--2,6-diaminopimelate ligase
MYELLSFLKENKVDYVFSSKRVDSIVFSDFCLDGRSAKQNNVFIVTEKNTLFINQAVNNGCVAVIVDVNNEVSTIDSSVPIIQIDGLEKNYFLLLRSFYQLHSLHPKIIGITGTNGKTSTAHFLAQLLSQANYRVGILGTLGNGIYDSNHHSLDVSELTTLDTIRLYQHLSEFNQQAVDYIVLEVSSHGIQQNRIAGLIFDAVCFTNLSREHLDYHTDMEQYFDCKMRLFSEYVDANSRYIVNITDTYGKRLFVSLEENSAIEKSAIFSYQYQDYTTVKADSQCLTLYREDSHTTLDYQGKSYPIPKLLGICTDIEYQNLLCAFTVLLAMGIEIGQIIQSSLGVSSIEGRVQTVSSLQDDITVIVDYAHTSDALLNILSNLKNQKSSCAQLLCVFGCGGNRDVGKRQLMGEVAAKLCDKVYITDDNPRDEEAALIRQQIIEGVEKYSSVYEEIADRSHAISIAIENAPADAVVLIAGKGHEKYQLNKGIKTPFDDVLEAKNALQKRTAKGKMGVL